MPIYEYVCDSCEHVFDALQKMSDEPLVDCPDCGEPSLRKLLSAPTFRLAGKGWYETDFKKDNKRNLAGDAEAKSTSKDAGQKKSDTGSTSTSAQKSSSEPASDSKANPT